MSERKCGCGHWWQDHNDDGTCAICGCDWFVEGSGPPVGNDRPGRSGDAPEGRT